MKTNASLALLFLVLSVAMTDLRAQEPAPAATPNDVPAPVAGPSPSATPAACPICGMATKACEDVKPAKPADETADLTKLEQDWADALARNDVAFLDRVEADEYAVTSFDGSVAHKAELVADAKLGLMVESYRYNNLKARVYGETAVVTGECVVKWSPSVSVTDADFLFTDVFVKRDGRWQAVASQATTAHAPTPQE